nr:phosphoadenosine phosphosulfate reductase family protein [Succinivibrio dextrinosolvens]
MYSYEWDSSTGGYILKPIPLTFSKEPRPVYYKELDILGFDKYWAYDKNNCFPYMWAEANNYYYRGRLVAKTKGGTVCKAPEIELIEEPEQYGSPLRFVDIPAMVEKNRFIMEHLEQETIKAIYNTYVKYKKRIDVFYVAFSGGKDSVVTLDLVQRALPHNEFKVLFGDTGMEFPDTYKTVDVIRDYCSDNKIDFIVAKSDYSPDYTWSKFGPPATVNRWCCSVHKTSPQITVLRDILGKPDFTGMAFIGVRGSESASRNEYDFISLGEKHKGQYSCNPILEWNSAELYLHIFKRNLYLNEAYKKGNRRAGCLVCPRAAERNEYMARSCYPEEFNHLLDLIIDSYKINFTSTKKLDEFISKGGWKARKNGRDLSIPVGYEEKNKNGTGFIYVSSLKTEWKEWIKTVGVLKTEHSPYIIDFRGTEYSFEVKESEKSLEVKYSIELVKEAPLFIKLLKNVFRKAACCIGCRECEADCPYGMLSVKSGIVKVASGCHHCSQCHKADKGCLVYKSLEMPKGGNKMGKTQSLNCFSHHAPKKDWLEQYFEFKNDFNEKHRLGTNMFSFFKRFLRDSGLLDGDGFTHFAEIIDDIGLDNDMSWALMLTNLAYNPQIGWYVKNIKFNETMSREYICSLLVDDGADEKWVSDVWGAFGRFVDLGFSKVGMGAAVKEKNKFVAIYRTPWMNFDDRVVLYSLYKFAEACGDRKQFSLSELMNDSIERAGVSPTQIFGLERDTMEKILNGLTFNYPDFIEARFTLGLDSITLKSDMRALEVLSKLF